MTQNASLIIRADANADIGTGHLMRCLALGQAFRDAGGEVAFVTDCTNSALLQRLFGEGFAVHQITAPLTAGDSELTKQIASDYSNCWVVLDGYHFDSKYQSQIKNARHRLLVIDDLAHLPHYYGDLILNQNLGVEELTYSSEAYTRKLAGTKYVLLRREFRIWPGNRGNTRPSAKNIIVLMGGVDRDNLSLRVIDALNRTGISDLEAVIVVGPGNCHWDRLQDRARASTVPIRIETNVADMPNLMARADIAVTAAGTTSWELAFMGIPSLLIVLAENQRNTAERLDQLGAAWNMGTPDQVSEDDIAHSVRSLLEDATARLEMTQSAKKLVDGRGSDRVVSILRSPVIGLRRACEGDCALIWNWANDPSVRAMSFSSDGIPWESHVAWFKAKLYDQRCHLYIATNENEQQPLGQVRLDMDGSEATISVALDRNFRGKGYGSAIIQEACRQCFAQTPIAVIHAFIKSGNEASVRAFRNAEFIRVQDVVIDGQTAHHLMFAKGDFS